MSFYLTKSTFGTLRNKSRFSLNIFAQESSRLQTFNFQNHGLFRIQSKRLYSKDAEASDEPENPILIKVENGIRSITFNRPQKKNALNLQMAFGLTQALMESNDDENTNIVVLTGTGDFFTSGMDLRSFGPKKTENPTASASPKPVSSSETPGKPENPKRTSIFGKFASSFINCKKPLIALVNGPTFGFGVTMLGLFDSIYCSERATFHTRFTEWGLPPEFCSTFTFPRIMGYGKASHMLLFNNKINAEEAYKCGLVSRIFPHETFHEETLKIVQGFAQLPIKSLIYSKELVRGREHELYREVSKNEQAKFDPELAKEVKRKFAERKLQSS